MASNALNRLEPRYYRVDIVGAVDNLNAELYAQANGDPDIDYSDELPATKGAADDIEYTNMRYEEVIRQVSERIQPLFTADIITTSRTADIDATAISFTLPYDRPEYIITEDELNDGDLIGFDYTTAEDAIQRWVARALIEDINQNRFTYDPTVSVGNPRGGMMEAMTAPLLYADIATAEGNITVTEITMLVD